MWKGQCAGHLALPQQALNEIHEMFSVFDLDGDGFISVAEIEQTLKGGKKRGSSGASMMREILKVEDLRVKVDSSAPWGEELTETKPCDYAKDWGKHATYDYKCDFGSVLMELEAGLYNNTDGTLSKNEDGTLALATKDLAEAE